MRQRSTGGLREGVQSLVDRKRAPTGFGLRGFAYTYTHKQGEAAAAAVVSINNPRKGKADFEARKRGVRLTLH